ncbi:MAG TPA: sigma 54-interacting transcriptional regulator [Candidatus Polarisedimenticolia bacterium]|nr:sigma 54-interacting transcriptional regulator [Candidatus Polarisedimenticolia bacterium]
MGNGPPGIDNDLRSHTQVLQPAGAAPVEPGPLAGALSRIARIVSETLELKEVFERVAEAAATVLPFDNMGVSRLETPETMRLYAKAGTMNHEGHAPVVRLQDFSPLMRSGPGSAGRIDDAALLLDPTFPMDRSILERGVRSILRAPLTRGGEFIGSVWFTSERPGAFTADHETAIQPIADLLGLALEHERLWSLEADRRRRLDAIDSLLPMLAGTLDVRGIFNRVSETVQPVLPHDRLVLTSLSADQSEITVDAISGEPIPGLPTRMPASDAPDCPQGAEYVLIPDVEAQSEKCAGPRPGCRQLGIRSLLKIPLRVDGGRGWLLFLSRSPGRYSEEDVVVARRVADHVSLALSHQRLAEEEKRATEARERATHLEERVQALKAQLDTTLGYHRVIGDSKPWKSALTQAAKVAPTETTVLLTGESGTGKEVVARFIHRGSPRSGGPFVGLNCAALPETLLESELFGHEKGAFTGAVGAKPGLVELADGGTLLLDEIGELEPDSQVKLLRALEAGTFFRVGAIRPRRVDVRLVAATNRDLAEAMKAGEFRQDLYYRINTITIRLPPLRERREDIALLAGHFVAAHATYGARQLGPRTLAVLEEYAWPGNVRELLHAIERAAILSKAEEIQPEDLPPELLGTPSTPAVSSAASLQAMERQHIVATLREVGGHRGKAAALLAIDPKTLYRKLIAYGIKPEEFR